MSKSYRVAVVGATGVVGQELIQILEDRNFPVASLKLLASERSAGTKLTFKDEMLTVEELKETSFSDIDVALFSAGGSISKDFVPKAVEAGAVAIDNTSYYRMHEDVPLVVPEVNADHLDGHKGIIANPNCSTAQMVMALKPIHDAAKIKRIVVSTYQAVSGAGSDAITELENQVRLNLAGKDVIAKEFTHPIAFNVIPRIDVFTENGYTKEEMKMVEETKKILGDPNIQVSATAVRVPVFIGHSESINIQTEKKLTVDEVKALLTKMPGVEVMDDTSNDVYPTPKDLAGRDETFVGRIREDISQENGIDLWCVSDNLRKGAALNAIQIAETLFS